MSGSNSITFANYYDFNPAYSDIFTDSYGPAVLDITPGTVLSVGDTFDATAPSYSGTTVYQCTYLGEVTDNNGDPIGIVFSVPDNGVIFASNGSYVSGTTFNYEPGVAYDVPCFVTGTLIRTPAGDVAVESLQQGDAVTVTDGRTAAIRWIGRRTVNTRFADALTAMPIRIKAGALGEAAPSRDLLVSPDHALLVDDVLIHAGALVNDVSIVRETAMPESFTYYHVELADHALILAENLAAETFIDNASRMAFDNWAEHEALHADAAPIAEMNLPRAKSHRQVPPAIRARLLARGVALYGPAMSTAA
jgi:hypothetical protein